MLLNVERYQLAQEYYDAATAKQFEYDKLATPSDHIKLLLLLMRRCAGARIRYRQRDD